MVIQNKTVLSGEEVYQSLLKASKKNYRFKFIFCAVLAVISVVILLLSMVSSNQADNLVIGFAFLIITVLYLLVTLISFFRIPAKLRKTNESILQQGIQNDFTFKEESFSLITHSADKTEKYEYTYSNLNKIVELEEVILFNLSATEIFICKKNGFKTPKEMDVFFYGLSKHKIKVKKKMKQKSSE